MASHRIYLKPKAGALGWKALNPLRQFALPASGRSGIAVLAALALTFFCGLDGAAQNETSLANLRPKRILMLFSEGKDVPGNILL